MRNLQIGFDEETELCAPRTCIFTTRNIEVLCPAGKDPNASKETVSPVITVYEILYLFYINIDRPQHTPFSEKRIFGRKFLRFV